MPDSLPNSPYKRSLLDKTGRGLKTGLQVGLDTLKGMTKGGP